MKTLNILALSLLISSSSAHAVNPLPPKPFKTPLQKEMDARGFKEDRAADYFIGLIDKHSGFCKADLNSAGNIVVIKTPSGELVVSIGLLSKISRKNWDSVYNAC